ncbi:MAG: amidohydrolase [Candidatus Izimaplasma sp.]|nr:amidohydrolase [Candidatus Izimaplasma bacterium]
MELLKKFRTELHKIPETSYNEFKTKAYLKETLLKMGYNPISILETGLYVYIDNKNDETIAFRSDIDGLPVQEQTNLTNQSTHEGFMHACGHDGHMAMLLGLADYLKDKVTNLNKNVLLIFQPAEESIGGAKRIVESGLFQTHHVSAVFGIHLFPEIKQGVLGSRPNEFMAMANEIDITVIGKGAHGAMPHLGIDANLILSKLLVEFQTIQTRLTTPLESTIITFGKMSGGTVRNQISETASMAGTIRSFDKSVSSLMVTKIEEISQAYEHMYGCDITISVKPGYLPVKNDQDLYNRFKSIVCKEFEYIEFDKPFMIAEDFSFYQETVPGVFFFLGTKNEALEYTNGLHSPKFNFDPNVLKKGLDAYVLLLIEMSVLHV